ncbi:DoxX family protein [Methylobacterium nodulans]|uniref:DoxX family protein n=1 Tax=Methylobacterium nodulans (strain LMG 21967 / CNCM I-2342 / ORS 2060) TaxID=460265 RepID=B8ISS3_METNO|nr:DoxX family protein [Methylobacterium nodulans]ACL60722.1 DoxX family protein [Methylobacterium nodulans ORS 2060]
MTGDGKGPRIGGVVLRGVLTAVFALAAGMKLMAVPFEVASFTRFGYPLWFMTVVGVGQLLGVALLWVRGWTAHGALLLAAIMVGAVASHLRAGDPVPMMLPAALLLCVLLGLVYVRRAEWRMAADRLALRKA